MPLFRVVIVYLNLTHITLAVVVVVVVLVVVVLQTISKVNFLQIMARPVIDTFLCSEPELGRTHDFRFIYVPSSS